MSSWQPSPAFRAQQSVTSAVSGSSVAGSSPARSSLDLGQISGVALLALGAAMFALGIFHGFENGSCSSTGYSGHYGPVQHCGKGIGLWMLILTVGIFVALGGAMLSSTSSTALGPVMFIAIGAPFVALALRSGNSQLLIGRSSSTGKLSAGIFGGGFIAGGATWGVVNARSVGARFSGGSSLGGIVAALVGVGVAFALAAGVASAIGPAAPTGLQQAGQAVTQSARAGAGALPSAAGALPNAAAARQTNAAIKQANAAISLATRQAAKATKLAACVSAAGANSARIQRCESRYMP